jgi:hypothetical protein
VIDRLVESGMTFEEALAEVNKDCRPPQVPNED